MLLLRTVIHPEGVCYRVERESAVLWERKEFFGRDDAHQAGGYAFQAASKEQEHQKDLAQTEGESVEETTYRTRLRLRA